MYYVKQQITGFTASNLTETYPEWNPATTYIFQETSPTSASIVRYGSWYYRSLINGNLNFDPETYENVKWVKYQVANSHAMLDLSAQSKSRLAGDISVTFALPTMADIIGVGYYEADTVLIELLDDLNNVVWSQETASTYSENVYDWYTWTFAEKIQDLDRSIAIRIPIYIATKARVTFNRFIYQTESACGFLICGQAQDMGSTLNGASFKFNSYSIKDTDDFGNISIVKRSIQDTVDFDTTVDRAVFMRKKRTIKADYDTIMMFVLDDDVQVTSESMVTLGVIQDASPVFDEFDKSVIAWSVIEAI